VRGQTLSPGYLGQPDDALLDADGFYHTGDLAWVDEDRWVYLVGREKELLMWSDGTLIDPMRLSNLLVRSIWVKDALVTRLRDDDFLSAFLFPDWPRIDKDPDFKRSVDTGLRWEEALRGLFEEAIDHARVGSGLVRVEGPRGRSAGAPSFPL
jgi:long-subunit acyl-CoA synthetase (AMP-forming)